MPIGCPWIRNSFVLLPSSSPSYCPVQIWPSIVKAKTSKWSSNPSNRIFLSEFDAFDFIVELPLRSNSLGHDALEGSNPVNPSEGVRCVRRRKFGRKRRSVFVKSRMTNKNLSNVINDADDEHSQEYIARRRSTSVYESAKEDDETTVTSSSSFSASPVKGTSKPMANDQSLPSDSSSIPEPHLPIKNKRLSHISASESDLAKLINGVASDPIKQPFCTFLEASKRNK